ncbi:MAG: DUF1318 domain-containing protein [Candidatus Hydrogenedentota bacterium]|nr:MAG: DUF1318 domain-containing protein [Candidatus Hydrogenedentota bacterium]
MTREGRMIRFATGLVVMGAILSLFGCVSAADPYNLHPAALRLERAITGPVTLEPQSAALRRQYVLYEGEPHPGGGITYRPFAMTGVTMTPELGDAILGRKRRFGEVFGLLSRGAAGESADNELVPRVAPSELTRAEQEIIDAENRDRKVIVETFLKERGLPEAEASAVKRVMAFARYQVLPRGIWVEKQPGHWVLKGGAGFREKVLSEPPMEMEPLPQRSTAPPPPPPRPAILEASPTVRKSDHEPSGEREERAEKETRSRSAVEQESRSTAEENEPVLLEPEPTLRGEPETKSEAAESGEEPIVIESPAPRLR